MYESIVVLTEIKDKNRREPEVRRLWRECFGDPLHYENFYFQKVYPHNTVYIMSTREGILEEKDTQVSCSEEVKGMIHLNPYRCRVFGTEMVLPYIVGVATDAKYRRQGVMRALLERVLSDMQEQGLPFTYLMPAKEQYYRDFGFFCVSRQKEVRIEQEKNLNSDTAKAMKEGLRQDVHFVSYSEVKQFEKTEKQCLFEKLDSWLRKRYTVYAIHDETYFDLLYAEKSCQGGDVIFCYQDAQLCAVFAYALEEELPRVEQMITAKDRDSILKDYFSESTGIKVTVQYPYMIRVVDKEKMQEICEKMDGDWQEHFLKKEDNIYFAEIV